MRACGWGLELALAVGAGSLLAFAFGLAVVDVAGTAGTAGCGVVGACVAPLVGTERSAIVGRSGSGSVVNSGSAAAGCASARAWIGLDGWEVASTMASVARDRVRVTPVAAMALTIALLLFMT